MTATRPGHRRGDLDKSDEHAVVTGANSGLGWEATLGLAKAGATVVMACRSAERAGAARERILNEVPDAAVEVMLLDLASLTSVTQFAKAYQARFDRLDILVNNAGVMFPDRSLTEEGFELQFGVNHLGHFALTLHLMPLLRKSAGSRIVTVTSLMHWLGQFDLENLHALHGYNRVTAYGFSKLCNLLFTFELARRLKAEASFAKSVAVHPGLSRSNLAAHSVVARLGTVTFGQSAKSGAVPLLHAALDPDAVSGEFYGPKLGLWGGARKTTCSPAAKNTKHAAQLWRKSEELAGVSFSVSTGATV